MTSKAEQKFLWSLGHTVVDDPDAFGLINANSLVIFFNVPNMQEYIVRGAPAWPAALVAGIYFRVPDPMADMYGGRDEIESQIQQFEEAYKVMPFIENKSTLPEGSDPAFIGVEYPTGKYNFHLRKDLDGAAGFSFTA